MAPEQSSDCKENGQSGSAMQLNILAGSNQNKLLYIQCMTSLAFTLGRLKAEECLSDDGMGAYIGVICVHFNSKASSETAVGKGGSDWKRNSGPCNKRWSSEALFGLLYGQIQLYSQHLV